MANPAGYRTYAVGTVITADLYQTYLQDQVISVHATEAARDTQISSPAEGMFAFTKDTDTLWYYGSSSAWVATSLAADITAVLTAASSSLAGGGSAGSLSLSVDVNNTPIATAVAADYVLIEDVTDGSTKKALVSDITALATGDITSVQTNSNSGLSGGVTSGDAVLAIDANNLASVTGTTSDYIIIEDATDNSTKKCLASDIASDPIPLILALS